MMALCGAWCSECVGCGECEEAGQPEPVFACDCCGVGIYEDEQYLLTPEGGRYCEACAEDMKTTA